MQTPIDWNWIGMDWNNCYDWAIAQSDCLDGVRQSESLDNLFSLLLHSNSIWSLNWNVVLRIILVPVLEDSIGACTQFNDYIPWTVFILLAGIRKAADAEENQNRWSDVNSLMTLSLSHSLHMVIPVDSRVMLNAQAVSQAIRQERRSKIRQSVLLLLVRRCCWFLLRVPEKFFLLMMEWTSTTPRPSTLSHLSLFWHSFCSRAVGEKAYTAVFSISFHISLFISRQIRWSRNSCVLGHFLFFSHSFSYCDADSCWWWSKIAREVAIIMLEADRWEKRGERWSQARKQVKASQD